MGKSCILVIAFMLLVMIPSSLSLTKCKRHELEALLKFKRSFTHDPVNRLSSWIGDDCCQWLGVTCENVTGNIIKLNLRNSPQFIQYKSSSLVSSELSSALLELKFLTHLDLSLNNFTRSRIPKFIGSMTTLRYLNLSWAGFSGQIPSQLGNLTNLIHLDLSVAILFTPQKQLDWASGLSKLQSLGMIGIDVSETHDPIQVLIRLPSLLALDVSGCLLQNTNLPMVLLTNITMSSSTLRHLDLTNNNFEGPFPYFLKHMLSLQSLSLSINGFNGSVPLWLRNMRRLEFLDLTGNRFTNVEGGMSGIMGNACNFKHLDLSHNLINQDDMLQPFSNSSRCAAYDLEYLDVGFNELNGSLPFLLGLLGRLTKFMHLDLSNNEFQGPIPESIAKLSALRHLDLSNNRLSGLMPDVLGKLTELEYLDISSNSIQGTVPGICNLSKLSYLDMSFNSLNLTTSFNCRPHFQLQVLNVHSCGINTVFPQWLRNQTQLYLLDLSNTSISGKLPEWIWNLTYVSQLQLSDNQLKGSLPRHIVCDGHTLEVLELNNNMLSGTIPHWLGHLKIINVINLSRNWLSGRIFEGENTSSFFNIQVLDLSDNMLSGEIRIKNVYPGVSLCFLSLQGNHFSGHISSQLCHFPNLQILQLAHNRLTGHIPPCLGSLLFDMSSGYSAASGVEVQENIKGVTQRFTGTRWTHSIIDLSSNGLFGTIPEELTNISKLMELHLSNNHLTGCIPGDIGNLQLLESFDLSNNNLSGTIPQSMSAIFGLSFLNLSNNHLYGPIPTGRQLQTLVDPSIYAGNSGLCGFPLLEKRNKPSPTNMDPGEGEADMKDKREKMWFYLVIMLGVATGFWGVVGTLVFKKKWRHSYFRFVEETADKVYVPVKVRMNRFKNRQRKKSKRENSGH